MQGGGSRFGVCAKRKREREGAVDGGKMERDFSGYFIFQLAIESVMSFNDVETKMSLATRCVPVQIAT